MPKLRRQEEILDYISSSLQKGDVIVHKVKTKTGQLKKSYEVEVED